MDSTRISRMTAVGAWLKLGYLLGCDAGTAFCLMLPIGLRIPFRMMAEAHIAAHRSRRTQSESVIDQIGYFLFQVITYVGVVPASCLGRFLVGPLLGMLTLFPFCVAAVFGAIRRDAPHVDHFNWFSTQVNRYGAFSVWGAIGTSLFLTVLMGLGYLLNVSLSLPGMRSTWSIFGLVWAVPFCCSFIVMSLMGVKQWLLFTKKALMYQGAAPFPLTGMIQTLKLSERQKRVLLDLFQDEHKKLSEQFLYQQMTAACYDPSLLLAQLQFARDQQQQTEGVFFKNVENRKLKVRT